MSRLLKQVRAAIRTRQYSPRTERAYRGWVVRYVRHCRMRHPRECGEGEVRSFLEHLVMRRRVGARTQAQALAALLFLYRDVLGRRLGALPAVLRPKGAVRLPNVLEPPEVDAVIARLSGLPQLVVMLLYGAGLRLNEALALRVKDVDLQARRLMVRAGKGNKDRRTMLPERLVPALAAQVDLVRRGHVRALARGGGRYPLPDALARKMPGAVRDWRWAWLFPAAREVFDRSAGHRIRFHLHPSTVQRALTRAALAAGLNKRVTAHAFRHSFATHLLRAGYDIRTVQELLGHTDVSTTMVYLHVLDRGVGVRSPLDQLGSAPTPHP